MPVSFEGETCGRLSRPYTAGYSRRTALAAPVVEAKEKLVNDRHPSGILTTPTPASDADPAHQAPYGTQEAQYGDFTPYGGYDTGAFPTDGHGTSTFAADPLFGSLPGDATGAYDNSAWNTGGHQTLHYDAYAAQHHSTYDTGAYETTAWGTGQHLSAVPPQTHVSDASGQWDASGWLQPDASGGHADGTQQWEWGTQTFETGTYDATQWNSDGSAPAADGGHDPQADAGFDQQSTAVFSQVEHPHGDDEFGRAEHVDRTGYDEPGHEQADYDQGGYDQGGYERSGHDGPGHGSSGYDDDPHHGQTGYDQTGYDQAGHGETGYDKADYDRPAAHDDEGLTATGELPAFAPLLDDQEEIVPAARAAGRAASRSRRRPPPKRSALLTIAVPSACVMGVAGIAAASVGTLTGEGEAATSASASDAQPVQPSTANIKLDTQLQSLSAGADDFADRASRTQERIDLKAEQVAEKKKAIAEAARKERLRPKYALPVAQRGLSAYFGQAGINWMSVHTGIDFPVSYGTTVMAATDGVARTQWNSAYGNMMIVTAKDGTETWYCHLSTYRVASGTPVKAGDPIAYSGNSGNSTGPHLHFEVRPAGGSAIDPLPWLRSHGIDPT
ncbi:peptidoglycan DD-metalloendopeptidase family protein [Streptomyces griseoviridis]